jgi:membrane glycosyltransferase
LVEQVGDAMTLSLRLPITQPAPIEPLPMPDQNLRMAFQDPAAPGIKPTFRIWAVRVVTLITPLFATLGLGWVGLGWFALDGPLTALDIALVSVTTFAGYWLALSVCTALLGLFWRPAPMPRGTQPLSVAILCPMYGEPAAVTIGNAVKLLAGLSNISQHRFSVHILSDTRDGAAAMIEQAVVCAAQTAHPYLSLTYRRRQVNTDYKSGNIRDWVVTNGRDHQAMLILDADSVMRPQTVVRLVDTLASEPGLGLVQTVPRVLPGHTVWQRMQSFASEVYGTNLGRGFAMWAGDEALFLGHNALVRTKAFAACAGLPHLPGPAPRGGVILSHDFVEAALLRRAGWGVRLLPEAVDSFEDTPETLPGYLRRDGRWCQGNMQHLRLLAVPGLHPVSRFHLLHGAVTYLASVWWMVLLGIWALPDFGHAPLMPALHDLPPITQAALAAIVGLMLLGPKVVGIAAHLREGPVALRAMPGFVVSVLVEMALSMLIAPTLMVHQVRAVLRTLAGFDGGWAAHLNQRPTLRTLARIHATETGLGAVMLLAAGYGQLTPWLLPVAVSLVISIPLSLLVQQNAGPSWLLRPNLTSAAGVTRSALT